MSTDAQKEFKSPAYILLYIYRLLYGNFISHPIVARVRGISAREPSDKYKDKIDIKVNSEKERL